MGLDNPLLVYECIERFARLSRKRFRKRRESASIRRKPGEICPRLHFGAGSAVARAVIVTSPSHSEPRRGSVRFGGTYRQNMGRKRPDSDSQWGCQMPPSAELVLRNVNEDSRI